MKYSKTTIAIPPGETIREKLQDRGMSQKEFAVRMDLSQKHVSKLINGEVQLTQDVAQRLEMVLGVSARFWNNLEAIYREDLERVRMENELEAEAEIARKFPYNEMAKNGWVPETRKQNERVINLRKFFEVVRLDLVMRTGVEQMACRRLSETEKGDYGMAAWTQAAKLTAREMEAAPIDIKGLEKALPEIRALNLLPPKEQSIRLREMLASHGIALVFLPHTKGSYLHGATFVDGKKIVMGITLRGRYADKFWFSIFHEIGHILLGHLDLPEGTGINEEKAADKFAAETLIPDREVLNFTHSRDINVKNIRSFAADQGIQPGIVVARLQRQKVIDYNQFNHLKEQYIFVSGDSGENKEEN
ncbi:MAG: helix-turn-helix domain-containing protein [Firmicutes bacterium]|nr:helix-turn-helix domain-containing protein [Bacillota bacterium]